MKQHTNRQNGISLLIVLLIGTIIILSSLAVGTFTVRMAQSLRSRSDAVQVLYTAEGVFDCVRYWLNQDFRNFSSRIYQNPSAETVVCNGQTFDFDGADAGSDPRYTVTSGVGVGEFTMQTTPLNGSVRVEVERSDHDAEFYEGRIRVYSQNVPTGYSKGLERFQEYYYYVLYGADVMFVIDRSGSIEGDRSSIDPSSEFGTMVSAVNNTVALLMQKVPAPRIGLLSFGTDVDNTGQNIDADNSNGCLGYAGCDAYTRWILPDVQLTDSYGALINDNGSASNFDDDYPNVELVDIPATNLSLALSIAGAELMGKYYPYSDSVDPAVAGLDPEVASGAFERIIAYDGDFDDLPDQNTPMDRDDDEFPDVIIILTDGAPNGIMTHVPGTWWDASVDNSLNFYTPDRTYYDRGSVKLFRTPTPGSGELVIDEHPSVPNETAGGMDDKEYKTCYDPEIGNVQYPDASTPFTRTNVSDRYLWPAMCNTTLIADKLANDSEANIKFITIFVTADCPVPVTLPDEAQWLHDDIAYVTPEGEVLFEAVCDYSDVEEKVLELFEKLELQQSR